MNTLDILAWIGSVTTCGLVMWGISRRITRTLRYFSHYILGALDFYGGINNSLYGSYDDYRNTVITKEGVMDYFKHKWESIKIILFVFITATVVIYLGWSILYLILEY